MARRDPLSGKFLPDGVDVRPRPLGFGYQYIVRDSEGKRIPEEIARAIVNAIRGNRSPEPVGVNDRLLYRVWKAERKGTTQRPGEEGEEDLTDRQRKRLRGILRIPNVRRNDSVINAATNIAFFGPGSIGGGSDAPHEIWEHVTPPPLRPSVARWAARGLTSAVVHDGDISDARIVAGARDLWARVYRSSGDDIRAAPLDAWRAFDHTLPQEDAEAVREIAAMYETLGISPGRVIAPGVAAYKLLRQFYVRPRRALTRWLLQWCETVLAEPLYRWPERSEVVESYIYDMNTAYASFLIRLPDGLWGEWRRTDRYEGSWGIYRWERDGRSGYLAGLEIEEDPDCGRCVEAIGDGWVWDGEPGVAHERFVRACLTYEGPARGVVRRFPVIVVGKSWSRSEWAGTLYWNSCAYPPLYIQVVRATAARVSHMYRETASIAAYVDSLHVRTPLPAWAVGEEPGRWRLDHHGTMVYSASTGWYAAEDAGGPVRHPGLHATDEEVRARIMGTAEGA
jgi:hypothetical protein